MPVDQLLFAAALIGMQPADRAPDIVTEIAPSDLPAGAAEAIEAAMPDLTIVTILRKEREGRVYLDVEGTRPDGSEVELDMLADGERYTVVEIQRDLAWADVPAPVRDAVAGSGHVVVPVRVIESRQTDGSIVYELFADGLPERPSLEVRTAAGRVEILREEWPH